MIVYDCIPQRQKSFDFKQVLIYLKN